MSGIDYNQEFFLDKASQKVSVFGRKDYGREVDWHLYKEFFDSIFRHLAKKNSKPSFILQVSFF
jgi:hypothetical protein